MEVELGYSKGKRKIKAGSFILLLYGELLQEYLNLL
jgi:hypothetical protein